MQATRRLAWLGVALLALPPGAGAAESEAERFQALEERMRVLEDKLAASTATVEAQQELLARHAPDVGQGSSLDAFFSQLEIGGFVTGSYLYNFNQPDRFSAGTPVVAQPVQQFNLRHDEFSFDAAKIEIGKAAANPGEGGFQFELLYGQNADILRGLSPTNPQVRGDSDMDVFVQEAYAAYNLRGVVFKLGKFETPLGYEVLDSHRNPNVTHGLLYTWAIPLYHEGLLASGALSENVTWSLGITDGFNNVVENNDGKALVGQLAYSREQWFASLSGFWGSEASEGTAGQPGSTDDLMIADAIITYSLSDRTQFWFNADVGKFEDVPEFSSVTGLALPSDEDPYYWGASIGGKTRITDKLSFAVRGEYFDDEEAVRFASFFGPGSSYDEAEVELWSLTGTLGYELTRNLRLRGEMRWDHADNDVSSLVSSAAGGRMYPEGDSVEDESLLGIVEVSYIFD